MKSVQVFLGLLTLAALSAGQVPTEVNFSDLDRSNPTPTFDHGYVVGWDMKQLGSLTLYAPDGTEAFSVTSLKLPDGTTTRTPISVAVDSDGTSAMAYQSESGRRSGFFLLDSAGKQVRVVETEPYMPSQVCFAPDHSVWTMGEEWKKADTVDSDYSLFRHYSREGKLIGAYTPRSALKPWAGEGLDSIAAPFVGHWRMRASNDRIGAAMNLGGPKQLWVEVDFSGKLIGQWSFTDRLTDWAMPAAFDSKGVLYGTHGTSQNHHDGIWILDRMTGTWKPAPSLPAGHLLGADGTQLVYQKGDQLRWIPGLSTGVVESAAATAP